MSTQNALKQYEKNPEELKSWLEQNRQNGFLDLDDQKKAFVYKYMTHYSHREAATEVGFNAGQGFHILREPLVQAFMAYLQQKKENYTLIDSSFIEVQYLRLYGKLLGEEEVDMVDKNGTHFRGKKFHAAEAVSALRDMAKSTKFFKEGSGQGGVNINFDLGALGIKMAPSGAASEDNSNIIDGEIVDD